MAGVEAKTQAGAGGGVTFDAPNSGEETQSGGTKTRVLRILGVLLIVASCAFLAQRIWVSRLWTLEQLRIGPAIAVVACGAVVYAFNGLCLSNAWWLWLRWAGQHDAVMVVCHNLYGRSQIAKYIPGNVFHFAGRHVLGRQIGFGHKPMVAAAAMEIFGLISAATVVALAGVGWFGVQRAAGSVSPWFLALGAAALMALPMVAVIVAPRLPGRLRIEPAIRRSRWTIVQHVAAPYLLYVLFMVVAGGLFVAVVRFGTSGGGDVPEIPGALIVGVFALSWLAGFLTPGASGGLGVREAAMVLPLAPYLGEPQALLAALLMRMVTALGDVAFFGLAHVFPGRADKSQ